MKSDLVVVLQGRRGYYYGFLRRSEAYAAISLKRKDLNKATRECFMNRLKMLFREKSPLFASMHDAVQEAERAALFNPKAKLEIVII